MRTCILTNADGENEDDCTTHEHYEPEPFAGEKAYVILFPSSWGPRKFDVLDVAFDSAGTARAHGQHHLPDWVTWAIGEVTIIDQYVAPGDVPK